MINALEQTPTRHSASKCASHPRQAARGTRLSGWENEWVQNCSMAVSLNRSVEPRSEGPRYDARLCMFLHNAERVYMRAGVSSCFTREGNTFVRLASLCGAAAPVCTAQQRLSAIYALFKQTCMLPKDDALMYSDVEVIMR